MVVADHVSDLHHGRMGAVLCVCAICVCIALVSGSFCSFFYCFACFILNHSVSQLLVVLFHRFFYCVYFFFVHILDLIIIVLYGF